MMLSRRDCFKTGMAGSLVMFLGPGSLPAQGMSHLDAKGAAIFRALIPAFLEGHGVYAVQDVLDRVDQAAKGLERATRDELTELMNLLSFAPSRILLAGVWSPWDKVTPQEAAEFLESWRHSGWGLFRAAYQGMHELVMAARYSEPGSWPDIGYPGPPELPK